MRRSLLATLTAFALLAWPAAAQQPPAETILVEGTQILYPGVQGGECFDLGEGILKIETNSPPGRTGETAYLDVVKAVEGGELQYLRTMLTLEPISAQYAVEPGRYCYTVSVTKRFTDTGDPNRPERPNKQVWLVIKHQRYR
jgi:hypothetical protein